MHCLNCSSVMGFGVSHSNFPLLPVLKQFLVCSEKVHKRSFTSRGSFFGNVTEGISVNEKTFALGSQILLSGYSKFVLFPEFFYLKFVMNILIYIWQERVDSNYLSFFCYFFYMRQPWVKEGLISMCETDLYTFL